MKPSKLNQAAALAAKKAAESAAADKLVQREYLEEKAKFDAAAEVRRQKYMKDWLAQFDDAAAEAAQVAAMAAFETAAQADPLMAAWLEVQRLYFRRHADGSTAQTFASLVGVSAPTHAPGSNPPNLSGVMQRAMSQLAQRLEGERTAQIFEAREAAAEGEGE